MNKVILLGRLVADVELKEIKEDFKVGNLVLAVDSGKEDTAFVDVTAFGRQAEVISQFVKKGQRLLIEGELKQERFETKEGQKRSKIKVILRGFSFVERKSDNTDEADF
jgi:single-strand DNA-binding protein